MDRVKYSRSHKRGDYPQLAHYKINCSQFCSSSINHPQISHGISYAKPREIYLKILFRSCTLQNKLKCWEVILLLIFIFFTYNRHLTGCQCVFFFCLMPKSQFKGCVSLDWTKLLWCSWVGLNQCKLREVGVYCSNNIYIFLVLWIKS